jgi:quercetin dioxygenase-like cupin family protein
MNRRDLCAALSSFAALAAISAEAQAPLTPKLPPDVMAVPAPPGSPGDEVLSTPRAFRLGELPVVKTGNGETRAIIRGVLPTGEAVEMHETTLLPGHMPIREGQMEFENDGKPERVGAGGVMFAASNIMHGLKNIGETPANYFVIAIGRETPATQI